MGGISFEGDALHNVEPLTRVLYWAPI